MLGATKVIKAYFDLLQQTIETNGLAYCPGQIFTCDETEMPLTQKWLQVWAITGDRVQITIMVQVAKAFL